MATLRDIKKRITSVKSTQKITKAMKMVAAAKLRRAQTNVMGARPYLEKLRTVVEEMGAYQDERRQSPLFLPHAEVKNVVVLVYTSNRGLCGGFNSNLLRKAEGFIREKKLQGMNVSVTLIGKKGRDFFRVRDIAVDEQRNDWAESFPFADAAKVTTEVVAQYLAHEIDEFYLIYNKFVSAISQENTVERLIPLDLSMQTGESGVEPICEPAKEELLKVLLPRFLAIRAHKAHLESLASELGARMAAMDSATKNAVDMIGSLTLKYNRVRQAAITTELMDIVNGAEALG